MDRLANYVTGLAGMWIAADGIYSLLLYIPRAGQSWLRDHSLRLVRLGVGVALIVIGGTW